MKIYELTSFFYKTVGKRKFLFEMKMMIRLNRYFQDVLSRNRWNSLNGIRSVVGILVHICLGANGRSLIDIFADIFS